MRYQHENYEPDPFQEIADHREFRTQPLPHGIIGEKERQRERNRQREIIRPKVGEPITVTLSCDEPDDAEGLYGPQKMYSVNRNAAMMYVDLKGFEAISRSGARQGDTIRIERTRGKWNVEICKDEPGPPPRGGRPDSALQSKPPANGNAYREPARPAPREVQAAAKRAAEMQAQPKQVFPFAEEFIPFLRAAAIACTEIAREATAQGHTLNFSTRDIAAIASTLYIQHAKGGR